MLFALLCASLGSLSSFLLPTFQASLASVDVIPLFIESSPDLLIDDEDILVSYPSYCAKNPCRTSSAVHIQHIPTGLEVESTGKSIKLNMMYWREAYVLSRAILL